MAVTSEFRRPVGLVLTRVNAELRTGGAGRGLESVGPRVYTGGMILRAYPNNPAQRYVMTAQTR